MEKVVVIAGSGRSGTTWIQDAIAQANGMRTLFEPLHPVGVPKAKPFAFRFIPAGVAAPELKVFMDTVFSGRMKSLWAEYRIRPDRFNARQYGIMMAVSNAKKLFQHYRQYRMRHSNGLVVKFTRANLMLPWLTSTYNFPTLYVVRHPCAIITSRLNLAHPEWEYDGELAQYVKDPFLQEGFLNKIDIDLEQPMSQVAGLACVWCIENVLPLSWAKECNYTVLSYETLLTEPEREWPRIVDMLALGNVPSPDLVERPSQQVSPEMRGKKFNGAHVGKWQRELSEKQLEEVEEILKLFGVTYYSVADPMPRLASVA